MTQADRAHAEHEAAEAERDLTPAERKEVDKLQRLSAVTVFATIRREGEEELNRPAISLWWSGIAAGIGLSTSVLAEAILSRAVGGGPAGEALAALGYTLGFVLVILSRLQLFTENTLTVVLPILSKTSSQNLWQGARLWGIVLAANLVGTFATALIALQLGTAGPENTAAMIEVARTVLQNPGWAGVVRGIPAGFYIAALVWMLPSSKGFEIFTIVVFAWLIAAGGFVHVIVGSCEVFLLALHGDIGLGTGVVSILLPALAGNVLGGTGLFALLAYGQIKAEIE